MGAGILILAGGFSLRKTIFLPIPIPSKPNNVGRALFDLYFDTSLLIASAFVMVEFVLLGILPRDSLAAGTRIHVFFSRLRSDRCRLEALIPSPLKSFPFSLLSV